MPEIYTNFPFESADFNSENFVKSFEDYIGHLEKVVKTYKSFVKFVKAKDIKILKTKGFPYAGSFTIDDIDAGRLKKANLVFNMEDEDGESSTPVFYIDDNLGEALSNLENIEISPPTIEFDEEDIEEKSELLNLSEVIQKPEVCTKNKDEKFVPGTVVVDVEQVGDHQYSFNLTIADLNEDPLEVRYDREKSQFEYKCGSCDSVHIESLNSVHKSLRTTSALLSNLIAMLNSKELAIALEFIDHDLRLLQILIALDYAIDYESNKDDDIFEDEDDS